MVDCGRRLNTYMHMRVILLERKKEKKKREEGAKDVEKG